PSGPVRYPKKSRKYGKSGKSCLQISKIQQINYFWRYDELKEKTNHGTSFRSERDRAAGKCFHSHGRTRYSQPKGGLRCHPTKNQRNHQRNRISAEYSGEPTGFQKDKSFCVSDSQCTRDGLLAGFVGWDRTCLSGGETIR